MNRTRITESTARLVYSLTILIAIAATFTAIAVFNGTNVVAAGSETGSATTSAVVLSPQATFPANAGTLGAIPDGAGVTTCGSDGAQRNVTFTVSGITAPLTNVEVSMTLGAPVHTWRGDLTATLIAPNASSFNLFRYIGSTTAAGCGSSNDFAGPYNFKDSAAGTNIWTVAATPTTAGDYRTTANGGAGQVNPPPVTNLTAAFSGLSTGDVNGTWTLRLIDGGVGDTGSISAASLTLVGGGPPAPAQHVVDYNGDGKTDWSVVRNTGGGPSGQTTWFSCNNGTAEPACWNFLNWGVATDFFVPEDYDGDNKSDIAVWRPGAPGAASFFIFQSATSTLRVDNFGQTGDDPTVVGDYDGDGKADPAVYRGGAASGDQSFWFYRGSTGPNNGVIVYNVWGQNGDFPAPGDYDGDGRNDFVVQRNAGGGQAIFWTFLAGTSAISNTIFGTPTDVIVPGDYDGDGKTDIATVRGSAGNINWFYKPSTAPAEAFRFLGAFGLSASDFPTQGDYDGDGRTDVAVWRPNADPALCFFYASGSTSGFQNYEWGQNGDYPVGNYNSH